MADNNTEKIKVLVVEDDPKTAQLIKLYLIKDGHKVDVANTGRKGLNAALENPPSIVLLDLMLPEMSGQDVCRQIREASDVPIIMVTARSEEQDLLSGLEMGADDYVTKPFSPRELVARVYAVIRRTKLTAIKKQRNEVLSYGGVEVDVSRAEGSYKGERLPLTATELRLLTYFLETAETTITRDQIMEHVFGYDFEGLDRTVDVHIHNLRGKLSDVGGEGLINTIYGTGYRFGN